MARKLYDAAWIDETLRRLAAEIAADPKSGEGLALLGARTRGAIVAQRLEAILREGGHAPALGFIDTTMYRDDLHTGAGLKRIQATEIDFDLNDRAVVLVDEIGRASCRERV
jgi:pyrimidine operon attenuation protein / uracil phosphoribosyltransferase